LGTLHGERVVVHQQTKEHCDESCNARTTHGTPFVPVGEVRQPPLVSEINEEKRIRRQRDKIAFEGQFYENHDLDLKIKDHDLQTVRVLDST
jgi:hypothetical protein